MKQFLRTYWKTLLFFMAVGVVGGFFTGLFVLESYPEEIREELYAQGLDDVLMGIITALQAAAYGIVLGAAGIWLGKKTGLWRDERSLTTRPLIITGIVSLIGGLMMILPDLLIFGRFSEAIMESYATKPSIPFVLASVTYGAVIEEVMLRLFMMTLIAFILHKLFERKSERPSTVAFVLANAISALLFALGHIPATIAMIGDSPIIILRCILLNGGLGAAFGYLYHRYGLRYSMIAHGGCHIVSKLIWILFI